MAKANNINYCVDTYYHFGSDATAAIRAGNNIMPAVFGVGCMNSHGYERTRVQAIEDCARLILAYVLSEYEKRYLCDTSFLVELKCEMDLFNHIHSK